MNKLFLTVLHGKDFAAIGGSLKVSKMLLQAVLPQIELSVTAVGAVRALERPLASVSQHVSLDF